jgi:general stress protein 26
MTDKISEQSLQITNFIVNNHVGVLATVGPDSLPNASVIYFATNKSNLHIYFITKEETTKSQHLKQNPNVSLVVFDETAQTTAQVRGTAGQVNDSELFSKVWKKIEDYSSKTTKTTGLPIEKLDAGGYVLFKITPQAIRLAGYKYVLMQPLFDVAVAPEESLE